MTNTKQETQKHIDKVRSYLDRAIAELKTRWVGHDKSKLSGIEAEILEEYTPKLAKLTYGSDEYQEALDGMKPMLDHHYEHNRHHPEHHKKGINDMNLIDLLEMILDWKAATLRHDNGCIRKSLEYNQGRFEISDQLLQVMSNTVDWLETYSGEDTNEWST